MNTYCCYYRSKETKVEAETSREAQVKGAAFFKAKKDYEVSVTLIAVGETVVPINTCTLGH